MTSTSIKATVLQAQAQDGLFAANQPSQSLRRSRYPRKRSRKTNFSLLNGIT